MKLFNKYKLSKNDIQLISNFKLDKEYISLSSEELEEVWKQALNINDKKIKQISSLMRHMKGYKTTINNTDYLIYSYYEKNFYNLFFYNLKTKNIEEQLDSSKEKIILFSKMCDIFLRELESDMWLNYKINLPKRNLKLYFKLISKFLKQLNSSKKFNIKKISGLYYFFNKDKRAGPLPLFYLKEKIISYKMPFIDRANLLKHRLHNSIITTERSIDYESRINRRFTIKT